MKIFDWPNLGTLRFFGGEMFQNVALQPYWLTQP
jgi:hypothetical protein